MKLSGYIYKFGNKIGNSDYIFDTDALKLLFWEKLAKETKVMCFSDYPKNVTKVIPNISDALGVCDFVIKEDGIYCNMVTLDTIHGRALNKISDDILKDTLRFGFTGVFDHEYSVSNEDKNTIYRAFEVPYIVLSGDCFHYPILEIER